MMKSKIISRKHLLTFTLVAVLGLAVFVNWYYTNKDTDVIKPEVTDEVNLGDAQYVSSNNVKDDTDYFTTATLNRTKAHDSAKEYLEGIINDKSSDQDTKDSAREKLMNITEQIKLEADMENLITAQTNAKCIVTFNGESVEVILPKGTIKSESLIKIKDIVISKTKLSSENITIIELK